LNGKKITILGLAFKPGTDDTRESPSVKVIKGLESYNANVWVHDPLIDMMDTSEEVIGKATGTKDLESALKDSDACILVTDWNEYREAGIYALTRFMKERLFIDGRRLFTRDAIPDDVTYRTVGSNTSVL
jgi:UDPglucose 6-dehydrogenase